MEVKDGSWWVLIDPIEVPKVVQIEQVKDSDTSTYMQDKVASDFVVVISDPAKFHNFSYDDLGRPYLLKEAWLFCEATSLIKELL